MEKRTYDEWITALSKSYWDAYDGKCTKDQHNALVREMQAQWGYTDEIKQSAESLCQSDMILVDFSIASNRCGYTFFDISNMPFDHTRMVGYKPAFTFYTTVIDGNHIEALERGLNEVLSERKARE